MKASANAEEAKDATPAKSNEMKVTKAFVVASLLVRIYRLNQTDQPSINTIAGSQMR